MNWSFIIIAALSQLVLIVPTHNRSLDSYHHHQAHNQFAIPNCDDTINGIEIDWAGQVDYFTCSTIKQIPNKPYLNETCLPPEPSIHKCLDEKIVYTERVPTSGPHRPVWVTYGEYIYMPPQRWIHAIEHGAAVFLFDPCADYEQIELLKSLARGCLRKHIITPYKNLPPGESFNVVTFGCRMALNSVSEHVTEIVDYLRRHAIVDGPEFHITENGNYTFGLIQEAKLVSDLKDSKICPSL